jgi:hypothetical protein
MVIKTTEIMPVRTRSKAPTTTIKYIIFYAVLPMCSPQLKIIQRQELMDVTDVITLTNDDGIFAAKQLHHHVCKLKAFLFLYNQKCISLSSSPDG